MRGGWSLPSDKQISRWLIGATVAPLIMVSAGEPWPWLLAVTGICGIAAHFAGSVGRWGGILQWAAAIVTLVILLPLAQQCWPTDPHPAVPLILLTLAVWCAGKGVRSAAGVGCVLFWFIIIMYSAMLAAMIPEVQARYMMPTEGCGSWTTILLLLIPAAPLMYGKSKSGWVPGVIATVAAVMTAAVLSITVSGGVDNPFHEAVRSVKIRLEPILSAAATAGWFLLLTVLLSVCGECAFRFHYKIRLPGILIAATIAAASLLCGMHIPAWIGVIFVAISWVFLPFVTQLLEGRKKMKKSEKTP